MRGIPLLALLTFSMLDVVAQEQAAKRTPIKIEKMPVVPIRATTTDNAASTLVAVMMPFVAPLVFESPEFRNTLVLANASTAGTTATLTLYSVDGKKSETRKLTLAPHEKKEITLASPVGSNQNDRWGSVTVDQDPSSTGVVVAGQVITTDERASIPAYIDEELAMPEMVGSTSLSAVTDQAEGPPLVGITNVSPAPQHVAISCLSNASAPVASQIEIASHATSIVEACSGTQRSSMTDYIASIEQGNSHGVFGVQIVGNGNPGSLAAFALAPHHRGHDVVFSSVPFYDPETIHSSDVVFAGVPIGPQETLPTGVYIPRLSLANFSDSPLKYSVQLADTLTTPVRDADGNSRPPLVTPLHTGLIPPHRTGEYAFTGQEAQSGLLHSVVVSTEGKPGSYQAKLVSRSTGNLYQIELLAKETRELNNGGVHPWTIADDNASHVVLFNHSDSDAKVGVFISSGTAIVWAKEMVLSPLETREVSINQLQSEQTPDDQGKRIPRSLKDGVVDWRTPDSGQLTGRLMVTSHDRAMARNFSCGTYYGVCSFYFETYSNYIQAGGDDQLYDALADYCNFNPNAPQQCGLGTPMSGTVRYTWSVGATNIISTSQPSVAEPMLHGVSAGTGHANVTASAGQCSSSGGGNPTVQLPSYFFSPSASSTSGDCAAGEEGSFYNVSYYVADLSSARVSKSGMTPLEEAPGTVGYEAFATPPTTNASGAFNDVPVGTCFGGVPAGQNACTGVFTVSYYLTDSSQSYLINTTTQRLDCALGQRLVIQGNPVPQNKTYQQGSIN